MRLVVAPTVIGDGRRLFDQPGETAGLELTNYEATPGGLLLLEYQTVGSAPAGAYEGVAALVRPAGRNRT
ncbi:hypothetical protein ACFV9C_30565 [Kribbella sp. NPDC059898]|uniref:hypothetical protein n=1 Tax=Kribbella sp. NPDC059898 TaxID=3346995 RepID=UPI00364FDFE1